MTTLEKIRLLVEVAFAGFSPNQDRAKDGKWTNGGVDNSSDKKPKKKHKIGYESGEREGESEYFITENGSKVATMRVSVVDNFDSNNINASNNEIVIDDIFVDEKYKRQGMASAMFDDVIKEYDQKTQWYGTTDWRTDETTYYEIPYKIKTGLIVSDEGNSFVNSVKDKIKNFNNRQPKVKKE